MKRSAFAEGVSVAMAGLLLYGVMAGIESGLGMDLTVAAILEELGKAMVVLGFGWYGRRAAHEGPLPRLAQRRALGLARGLSLGLVAVAVFAGAENMAFLVAFREAGILARLLWSLPVHLVAALLEALGVVFLFRGMEGRANFRARLVGVFLWSSSLCLAGVWHRGANALVSVRLASSTFAAGVVIANLLFLVLLSQFLKQAYIGGFLHGAE